MSEVAALYRWIGWWLLRWFPRIGEMFLSAADHIDPSGAPHGSALGPLPLLPPLSCITCGKASDQGYALIHELERAGSAPDAASLGIRMRAVHHVCPTCWISVQDSVVACIQPAPRGADDASAPNAQPERPAS